MAASEPLGDLVAALQRLPGIGARSATRLAYHILKTPREEADALCAAILSVKDRVTYCSTLQQHHRRRSVRLLPVAGTGFPHLVRGRTAGERRRDREDARLPRPLSRAARRDCTPAGIGPDDLKIKSLLMRISASDDPKVEEVIVATKSQCRG
jgi:recombination protein RecR